MRQLWLDLVYAARLLKKNPGFAAVAILSLAIGIGANSAMFSFADALILRPIPVPRPGDVVVVNSVSKSIRYGDLSYRDYLDYRDSAKTVSGLAAFQITAFGMSTSREQLPQLTYGMAVSGNFFQVLGVPPVLGRDFMAREDSPAGVADPAVIVSHAFWKQQLSGDPAALGRKLRLNGTEFTIAGVAPASFTGMDPYLQPALFIPIHAAPLVMATAPANMLEDRANRWLAVRGRLAPGVSEEAAKAEFSTLAARLAHAYPDTNKNQGAWVAQEFKSRFQRESLDGVLALMLVGIAGLVLVIACANLANLMLARGVARSREIAIRLSIGAGRGRLIRQFLTESLLISVLGGMAGLFVAFWLIRALALIKLPTDMPIVLAIRMDERVLLFSVIATILTGLLFGLVPAIRASKSDLVQSLKGATADVSAGRRRVSLRDVLVVAQVAVALAVLSSAGMLIQSFRASQKLNVGFRTDGVLMMSFDPGLVRMNAEQGRQFYRQLIDRVRAVPGVQLATIAQHVPLGFSASGTGIVIDGYDMPKDQENLQIDSNTIGTGYFETLRASILRGRTFDNRDQATAPQAVIINETMARRYWPNRDALGARIHLERRGGTEATVVGIAKDAKYRSTFEPPRAHMYRPFEQNYSGRMTLFALAKAGTDPAGLASAVRSEVRAINSDVPIFDVRSFRQFYDDRVLMPPRLISQIVGSLGMIGLTLAVIGLYGVIAYTVSRRTKELGIRMAIGAERGQVARLVLRQGLVLSMAGVALGLPLAFALSRLLSRLMVDRTGRPEPTLAVVAVVLIAVTMLAAWIPARRASKIDPMVALRYD